MALAAVFPPHLNISKVLACLAVQDAVFLKRGSHSPCCCHVCLGGEKAKGPRFLDAWHSHSNGETSRLQGHWRRVIGGEAVLKASYGYPHAESEMWILLGIHWLVSVGSCTIILILISMRSENHSS